MKLDLAEVVRKLRSADSVLITSHANPDGDAIGTMLAVSHFLQSLGKHDVTCVSPDPVPDLYAWLPGSDGILTPAELEPRQWDLAIIVDVAQLPRIGAVGDVVRKNGKILVLDHHLEENPAGDWQFMDTAYAACSEIAVDLFEEANIPMSRAAAECAYVGLVTDTGGFRFSNTNAAAHRRAAVLVDAGVDVHEVSMRLFDNMTLPKFALLRRALDRMTIGEGGLYAHTSLTLSDMRETQARGEDVDGIVNYARNLEGVEVGMLFREVDGGKVKVSMRSSGAVNVANLLQAFGGGGHAAASGATLEMKLQDAQDAVLRRVRESLSPSALGATH